MRTAILLAVLALAGCVPQRQWRTSLTGGESRMVIPADAALNRAYSLAFVEFGNDGKAWDPRQLDAALKAIDDADRRSNHRALVIAFIHGWKNNARENNNNVLDFRRQLNRIAVGACGTDIEHCGVVGVYLAWSGDVIKREWNTVRNLSYFNRRGVAATVATDPIADALFAVMKQAKLTPERSTNRTVVVGHSFGGLILEYSIHGRLMELGDELRRELGHSATRPVGRLKTLEQFADLVVLINQAAPADEAATLLGRYRSTLQRVNILTPPRPPDGRSLSRPLILSVSSESDLATRGVLPIAERLSPPKHHSRELPPDLDLPPGLEPAKLFTATAAHTPLLHSHKMVRCENGDCSPCLKLDKYYIPVATTLPAFAPGNTAHRDQPLRYCVVRDFAAWNRTPYWIFRLPPEIVPDHGAIFTDRFMDFLSAFLPPLDGPPPSVTLAADR